MSLFEPARYSWTNRTLGLLRIVAGVAILGAGTMKLFGFPPPPAGATGFPGVQPWEIEFAGYLETIGGSAIVLGLLTRPIAFLLAGEMAVAYLQVHARVSIFPTANGGMPALFLCVIFLYLTSAGAGAWSLDSLIAGARHRPGPRSLDTPMHARVSMR